MASFLSVPWGVRPGECDTGGTGAVYNDSRVCPSPKAHLSLGCASFGTKAFLRKRHLEGEMTGTLHTQGQLGDRRAEAAGPSLQRGPE